MTSNTRFYLKIENASNIKATIEHAHHKGYTGIITNVVNKEFKREFIVKDLAEQHKCFARSPLILTAESWIYNVIPSVVPPNLGINHEELAKSNELQFLQEFGFAQHLTASPASLISVKLTGQEPEALAVCIKNEIIDHFQGIIVAEVSMVDPKLSKMTSCADVDENETGEDQWKLWNKFHAATGYDPTIEVALVLAEDLPDEEEIKRWLGEKIAILIIPHSCFITNKSNYPCLATKHMEVLKMFLQYTKCSIAIEPNGNNDNRIVNYVDFVKYCGKSISRHNGHEDDLKIPLQPLYDNLDTSTYETFETDAPKYQLYQQAIEAALIDKVPESEIETTRLVLMILGAGRGPFIRAALNASERTGRKLKILVVEKNPNAIVTLTNLINFMWKDKDITLICQDMRTLDLKEKADIIVSELLGSFGDNELSPECLDGAQHLMKPDGISIPCNSISYVQPVMSSKIYSTLRGGIMKRFISLRATKKNVTMYSKPKEMTWLTLLNNVYYIDEPSQLFKFVHPNDNGKLIDNSRYKKLEFTPKVDCVLHGFAGYFTSCLYKDIEISIHPATHTKGMSSWYPMFIPVHEASTHKAGEKVEYEFWRKVDAQKVWFEWRVQDGSVSNLDGENHPIRL